MSWIVAGRGWWWWLALAVVASLPLIWLYVQARLAGPPPQLGVHGGRLAACPDKPNCVSTQAESPDQRAEPISCRGSSPEVLAAVRQVIEAMPGGVVVVEDPAGGYLRAEFRSRLFGFVDDVELLLDPVRNELHFRSASRVGYSDLGVNRARMERFRSAFQSLPEQAP